MDAAVAELSRAQIRALRCIAAYWRVWVEWSQDVNDVRLAMVVREGRIGTSTWNALVKRGMLDLEKRRDILGGGQATPLSDRGREHLKNATSPARSV